MKKLQPWLFYGIFYSLLMIIISILNSHLFRISNSINMLLIFIILIFLLFFTIKAYKNKNNGFLPYGETFKFSFLTAIIGFLFFSIFSYFYYNFIDTEGGKKMAKIMIEDTEAGYRNAGMSEERIMQSMEIIEKIYAEPFSISILSISFLYYILISLFIVAITSIFLKKDKKTVELNS